MSRCGRRVALPVAGTFRLLTGAFLLAVAAQAQSQTTQTAPAPAPAASAPAASDVAVEGADDPSPLPSREERAAGRARARELRGRSVQADWRIEIEAPDELRTLLDRYLDVSRFRTAVADDKITVAELSRLVAAAPGHARELLQTEGYFAARVDARLELPPAALPIVHLKVEPGPRAQVGRLTVDVQGALAEQAEAGDAASRALMESIQRGWSLPVGAAFTRERWADAKTALLTRLRADAYPSANWVGTAAQVDPKTQAVRVFVIADSGPRYRFGPIRIEGLSRYESTSVERMAPFSTGEPYSEKLMLDFQERLASVGLFDSVSVSIEPDGSNADAVPVLVAVRELQRQQATVGVGASADTGPRITLEHTNRRPFGINWQATTKIELGRENRKLELDLISHAQPRGYRNLVSGLASREVAAGLTVSETQLRVGRTQDTERIERLYYLELQDATTSKAGYYSGVGAVSGNYEWVWRSLDSTLLPTRGHTASARVALGHSFGVSGTADQRAGWFTRANARLTAYQPLGDHWFTTSRIEGGQVFAGNDIAVPFPLLFRAGGDTSVRGYGYQDLGPYVDDVAIGGRVLATASFEIARPFSLKRPEWLGAVFVDAGDASNSWSDFSPAVGVGVGVRWRSPVGPLNIDLAYGERVRAFRVHFSVGIAF